MEKLIVPGGEVKAKWFKTVVEVKERKVEGKTWVSEDVPGRIVKSEKTTIVKGMTLYTTTQELTEFKKP